MPIYYICPQCNAQKEAYVRLTELAPVICEFGHPMERQMRTPGFTLKGAGFYANDYWKRK